MQERAPLRPHPCKRPWQAVSIDVVGPYDETRKKNPFLLVATDLFSKYVAAQAVPEAHAPALVEFLETIAQR